ncbi:glycosyltransferase family 2 protein [Methylobacterium pseudosasicola]|uniref:Glycosyltransferase involved in cell wall bisynthesis n=1 Tax=Methylobacterium pseudosasicola TaxID=582667 RepID=A0A1I4HH30_9HYPH|nr:glycosyltransferase family A protein [Methylobacterium pseudosasicola]SFL40831.1 Glycosyltransferase involved in cell wall bisynthesis [Methylobacterium pseudosasicola]
MTAPGPTRVSVIVPTCNRPGLLAEALASIRRLEADDLTFEIVVGDNGTCGEAREVVAAYGAVYVATTRRGCPGARNAALHAATADLIAFLDDDDVWLPGNIRPQLALLAERPDLEAVTGQAVLADHNLDNPGAPWPDPHPGDGDDLIRSMLSGYFPQVGTLVVRRHAYAAIGDLDESLLFGSDHDWQMRFARRRTFAFTPVLGVMLRGRAFGTFTALQIKRQRYDRKIFLRHSLPEWRVWSSPRAFLKAYAGTLQHFYWYFVVTAEEAAADGKRDDVLQAVRGAFLVFPMRALYHLVRRTGLRRAVLASALRG